MNKKILLFLAIILLIGVISAGAKYVLPYEPLNPPEANDSNSSLEGIKEVTNSNNKFAFDLYSNLKSKNTENNNLFFSPYSISSAFSLVYEGSKNQTKKEIKEVFYFPDYQKLRPNYAAIYNKLNKKNKDYKLNTGNALWVHKEASLLKDYKNNIENYYGGKAESLDFSKPDNARLTINNFIERQTRGEIEELLSDGEIQKNTKLVITNAIYFEGEWELAFKESKTEKKDFELINGNSKEIDFMQLSGSEISNSEVNLNYADLNNLQILEFPYKDDLSMVLVLPTEDINSLGEIDYNKYKSWEEQMYSLNHNLKYITFPKFKFKTSYKLNTNLKNLGMPTPFLKADFSGMLDPKSLGPLAISLVKHKATIDVSEKGAKASAATAISVVAKSARPRPRPDPYRTKFIADHPFIFLIKQDSTGNILFLGEVNNPSY